jgi:hypothetical protein
MIQRRIAGPPRFPAASVALAENSCAPVPSPLYATPSRHGAKGALSSEHSKLAPGSLGASEKAAEVS